MWPIGMGAERKGIYQYAGPTAELWIRPEYSKWRKRKKSWISVVSLHAFLILEMWEKSKSLENKIESKVMILNWIITLKIMNNWNYVIIRHIREK